MIVLYTKNIIFKLDYLMLIKLDLNKFKMYIFKNENRA